MNLEKIDEFNQAIPILEKLEQAGYEAYFVGGCVRDFLLERKIDDIDITTSATPSQVKELFPKVIPVGIEHGTVIVRRQKRSYEVTTFRDKLSADNLSFVFGKHLADDLLYRDFTMNALAMDRFGGITDLSNGQEAIERKEIKAVEDPYKRFTEDPLRIVRACRFVSQLGFSIELESVRAIKQLQSTLQTVAVERLKDEMTALITGPYFTKALSYVIESGLMNQLPIFKQNKEYVALLQKQGQHFHSFSHMVAFLHYLNPTVSIANWIKAWNGSNKEKQEAKALFKAAIDYQNNKLTPWLVYNLDKSLHKPFRQIIDTIYKEIITKEEMQKLSLALPIQARNDLQVNGHLLMKWFSKRKPGKWIEEMLKAIERAVVMNELTNNEDIIKEWILCHPLATN